MADVKELSINNTTYDIKAKSVVDQNSGSVKMWTGTKAQYDAIVTKDSTTMYYLTDVHAIYLGDTLVVNFANRKLTEIYNNGTSWYKVFSEYNPSTGTYVGQWCEQGGFLPYTTTTVALLKSYSDTNYQILLQGAQAGGLKNYYPIETSKTASRFDVNYDTVSSGNSNYYWETKGYIS